MAARWEPAGLLGARAAHGGLLACHVALVVAIGPHMQLYISSQACALGGDWGLWWRLGL